MFRFQNWKVYQDARKFRLEVAREIIPCFPAEEKYGLADQLRRAVNSIILNIAEGSYRKTDKDFAHFLNQASASLYEVVSCLDLAFDSHYITQKLQENFSLKAEELAKQLSAFTKSLR